MTKDEAGYQERVIKGTSNNDKACIKCKFNLPDEKKCHIVEGEINNDYGVSIFFSPKGDGMLPGDIVWDFIKKTGNKLEYEDGHIINKGAEGYQCKDCKYYMYSDRCLLIKGISFKPEMSCAFVVKIGNGTDVQSMEPTPTNTALANAYTLYLLTCLNDNLEYVQNYGNILVIHI